MLIEFARIIEVATRPGIFAVTSQVPLEQGCRLTAAKQNHCDDASIGISLAQDNTESTGRLRTPQQGSHLDMGDQPVVAHLEP